MVARGVLSLNGFAWAVYLLPAHACLAVVVHELRTRTRHASLEPPYAGLRGHAGLAQRLPDDDAAAGAGDRSLYGRWVRSRDVVVVGLGLIVFSVSVLWLNEHNAAKMECLILTGAATCRTVSGEFAETANRGRLVHLESEPLRSLETVADYQFNVIFKEDCVRLRSMVQVFQHIEYENRSDEGRLGEGVERFSYAQEWRSQYQGPSRHQAFQNKQLSGLELGMLTRNCGRVAFGDAFELTDALISHCHNFQPAYERIGATVFHGSGYTFCNGGDSFFYYPWRGAGGPEVGDARVKFEYVPDGYASVIALQTHGSAVGSKRDSFLPCRLIPREWCGGTEEREAALLLRQGQKHPADLAADESIGGCFWICCCACNLAGMCYSAIMFPEIHHLYEGGMSAAACLADIRARSRLNVWIPRAVGCGLLLTGLYCTFSPFPDVVAAILLGPHMATPPALLVWPFCFVATVSAALLVVCLAYLRYRPLTALRFLVAAGVLFMAATLAGRAAVKTMAP